MNERGALLATLFDERVAVASGDPTREQTALFPEELALVGDASERRRLEFLNGRACAHAALRALGFGAEPLLCRADRAPLWPTGIVGSISHGDSFCAAAVARSADFAGIGLDIETDLPVSAEFARRVCSPIELARCAELGQAERLARVVFSAKESVYKLQYPLTGAVLYWRDLEVLLEHSHFSARFTRACPPFHLGQALTGRWLHGEGLILSGVSLSKAR